MILGVDGVEFCVDSFAIYILSVMDEEIGCFVIFS